MEIDKINLIQAIHKTPAKVVMAIAGAGTTALSDLLKVAGASNTLLEAVIPYDENAFADFLGSKPNKYVSNITARKLAGVALSRARELAPTLDDVMGISCTATISTTRTKRGQHRACMAYWSANKLIQYELTMDKGTRNRIEEEMLVSTLLLNLVAESMEIPYKLHTELRPNDQFARKEFTFAESANRLTAHKLSHFGITADGRLSKKIPQAILSGAFNPLHGGHIGLAIAASKYLNTDVAFECAAVNVDKPPLSAAALLARMTQFAGQWPVLASNSPTYLQKSRIYPDTTFIVGYDTAVRILDAVYYQNRIDSRDAALAEIKANNGSFLVASRVDAAGKLRGLADISIPPQYRSLFQALPAANFRMDISSTQIRSNAKTN